MPGPMIRIMGFGGEVRAINPRMLADGVGVKSLNQKPGRGDLRPWKAPLTVAAVPSGRKTIYRMGRDVNDAARYWLSWTTVVHAVRGFDAADTTERTYYTGDGAPKVTNNLIALNGGGWVDGDALPKASRPLGLPRPSGAPTVVADSVADPADETQTPVYVYTWANDWGWESMPSPPSTAVTRSINQTATISGFSTVPAGNYNVTVIRIYRTQTGASGSTDYYFLREIAVGTASTTDDNRNLNDLLVTTTWAAPPDDLSNLTALWAGMLAGISGNAVKVCEPFAPYAWPSAYDIVPPDAKPVALGVIGQQVLVLTTGRPLLAAGSTPESMDQQPLPIPQSCVSAPSAVSMGDGVAWASDDGLCWFGAGGFRLLTGPSAPGRNDGIMLREDWQAIVPSSIVGRLYEGLYFGSYDDGGGRKGFFIDPRNPTGIYFLSTGYETSFFDDFMDELFVLDGVNVKRWDKGASFMTCTFRSKVYRQEKPAVFTCAKVVANAYPVTLRVFSNTDDTSDAMTLRFSATVTSSRAFRLPAGYLARDWQVEVEGATPVLGVALATSMADIAGA